MTQFAGAGQPPNYGAGSPPLGQIPLSPTGQPMAPGVPQAMPQGQQPWPPQPQQQPQYQQQYQQQPQVQLGGGEILDGPGVPPELRGRRVADVMRIYSRLADDFISRRRQQPQPGQQPEQQPQQQPGVGPQQMYQQPNYQQQQQQPQGQQFSEEDQRIAGIVRHVVNEAVQPFQQQQSEVGRRSAYQQAREQIPDFQQLEPDIMDAVRGASDEALANPEFWLSAADLARGRRLRTVGGVPVGQQPQVQPQIPLSQIPQDRFQQPPGSLQAVPASGQYPQPVAPSAQVGPFGQGQSYYTQSPVPRPATHQFFTEAPTGPSLQQPGGMSLTPQQIEVARLAGISPEQYASMNALTRRF